MVKNVDLEHVFSYDYFVPISWLKVQRSGERVKVKLLSFVIDYGLNNLRIDFFFFFFFKFASKRTVN